MVKAFFKMRRSFLKRFYLLIIQQKFQMSIKSMKELE